MPSKISQAYFDGYQSAMQDIQRCLREGGWEEVQQWLKDNTITPKPKPLKWHGGNGYWTGKRADNQGEIHIARRAVDEAFPTVVDWIWEVDGEFRNAFKTLADVRYYAERYSRAQQLGVNVNHPSTDPTTNPL